MKTLFAGCDSPVQITPEMVGSYYRKASAFIDAYADMILTFCTEVYASDKYLHFPTEMKPDMELAFASEQNYRNVVVGLQPSFQCSAYLREFLEKAKELVIPRRLHTVEGTPIRAEYRSLFERIDPDKACQTQLFAEFILERMGQQETTYIDLGAGKGYLSQLLSFDLGKRVIAVEASLKHAVSLSQRVNAQLKRHYKQYVAPLNDGQADKLPPIRFAVTFVDAAAPISAIEALSYDLVKFSQQYSQKAISADGHELHSQVQGGVAGALTNVSGAQAAADSRKYAAVGLHACGDLSVLCLELAMLHENVTAAFTVPCCYTHLTRFPLQERTAETLKNLKSADHENQRELQFGLRIPRHVFNYSVGEFDQTFETALGCIESFHDRAVLEVLRAKGGVPPKRVIKREAGAQFIPWVLRSLADEGITMSPEQVQEKCETLKAERLWTMKAHIVVRLVAGQVMESLILIDRMLWAREHGLEAALEWCMGGVSGRGFALWGRRGH